jgi:hypothetical protein
MTVERRELVLSARADQHFTLDSLAVVARARAALQRELEELQNALTVLDYIEKSFEPARGVS